MFMVEKSMFKYCREFSILTDQNCEKNLLCKASNVRLSYQKLNNFQRNLDGTGILSIKDKFEFVLNGEGAFDPPCDGQVYFVSSALIGLKGRKLAVECKDDDAISVVKDLLLNADGSLKVTFYDNRIVSDDEFGVPYFECYIKSFKKIDNAWQLEFEEI